MFKNQTISVIIPCYNEEPAIAGVLDQIPHFVDEVLVVDNNSTDHTGALAITKRATVLLQPLQGYGHSIEKGSQSASGDILVVIDGDGTYPIQELSDLLTALDTEKLDFLSASRFPLSDPTVMKFYSKIGNAILTLTTKVLFGFGFKDSQSGMWLIRRRAYKRLHLSSGGMGYSEEIKIKAVMDSSIRFGEKHITYQKRLGVVKLKAFSDGLKNIWLLFKLRFSPGNAAMRFKKEVAGR